jgi:signal transduction histidine kinase
VCTVLRDLTERKAMQSQLLDISRKAGMAEVATGILHNVGNVLNSVNVSASLVAEQLKRSNIRGLELVAGLMQEHGHNLAEFLTRDPKGVLIPGYLGLLAQRLKEDQTTILNELNSLRNNVEHIKTIVAMQQSYGKVGGVLESVSPVRLVEDALRINASILQRHQVRVINQYDPRLVPEINVDKHRVLQILVNLICNAVYACDESGRQDKCVTLQVAARDGRTRIAVVDNGVGIPPENLTRIFNHGFTTRKDGHGFGLHSGALAAREMGGDLRGESPGPGRGATFTLELPGCEPGKTPSNGSPQEQCG